MHLSYNVLTNLIGKDIKITPEELSEKLTFLGFEVESITNYEEKYKNIVIGYVKDTKPHPGADKLQLCEVLVEDQVLKIVCGASNVRPGLKVPVSMIGAVLPNGLEIKKTTIRNEESYGMICSVEELDLKKEKQDGIMELSEELIVGNTFAKEYFDSDIILDISITPNRGDCSGIIGIAREISAFLEKENSAKSFWDKIPEIKDLSLKYKAKEKLNPKVKIKDSSLFCLKVEDITVKPSSQKVARLLNALGIKRHNNIVDVSNYISAITGIPIHIYDYDKLDGDLVIDFASENEEFCCLDESIEKLSTSIPVVKDSKKTVCIFGIMGSNNSGVSNETKNILIECGYVPPKVVMKGTYGIKSLSDARYRSERGIDFEKISKNISFTLQNLLEETDGKVTMFGNTGKLESNILIDYPVKNYNKITGVNIEENRARDILERLELKIVSYKRTEDSDTILTIKPPSHRHDMHEKEDITEEIIRLNDINKIPEQSIEISALTSNENEYLSKYKIIENLSDLGYKEVLNYMFVEEDLMERFIGKIDPSLGLKLPMNQLNTIHQSSILNLVKNLHYNIDKNLVKSLSLCEITNIFNNCDEYQMVVSGIRYGNKNLITCNEEEEKFNVFDIKRDLSVILQKLYRYSFSQIDGEIESINLPAGHPSRCYKIEIDGKRIAHFGQINPVLLGELFKIKEDVMFFELYVDNLCLQRKEMAIDKQIDKLSKEMSFLIDKGTKYGHIVKELNKNCNLISQVVIRDVFKKEEEFGKDKESINISFSIPGKNINEEEVNEIFKTILNIMDTKFQAKLRGNLS